MASCDGGDGTSYYEAYTRIRVIVGEPVITHHMSQPYAIEMRAGALVLLMVAVALKPL